MRPAWVAATRPATASGVIATSTMLPVFVKTAPLVRRPLVMSIVLHSFVLGQAYRARQFSRVVEHILRHRDRIWITRPGDICAHIESLPKGIVPGS